MTHKETKQLKTIRSQIKIKKTHECNFKEHLEVIKKEMLNLFQKNHLSKDIKFLRKMAVNIKQLHYDAKNAQTSNTLKNHAKEVEHFLSTPIAEPFVGNTTLTKAADTFSEQHPQESDLSQLLSEFAKYGKNYAAQLLRVFLVNQKK